SRPPPASAPCGRRGVANSPTRGSASSARSRERTRIVPRHCRRGAAPVFVSTPDRPTTTAPAGLRDRSLRASLTRPWNESPNRTGRERNRYAIAQDGQFHHSLSAIPTARITTTLTILPTFPTVALTQLCM